MYNNQYIEFINQYVNINTPVHYVYNKDKYKEILDRLAEIQITSDNSEVVSACYSLYYTSLDYHLLASQNHPHQSYLILLGDFISSYIAELLYKNHLLDVLKVFSTNSKQLMLNYLNGSKEDNLIDHIIDILNK